MTLVSILSFLPEQCEGYDFYKGYKWHHILHLPCFSFIYVAVSLSDGQIEWIFFSPHRKSPSAAPASGLPGTCLHFTLFLLPCLLSSHRHTVCWHIINCSLRILSSDNVHNCEAKLSCCWNSRWQVWAHGVEFHLPLDFFLNLDVVLVSQFPALTKYPNRMA